MSSETEPSPTPADGAIKDRRLVDAIAALFAAVIVISYASGAIGACFCGSIGLAHLTGRSSNPFFCPPV
jgi:cytochrome c oxidase assembly protein Cox11